MQLQDKYNKLIDFARQSHVDDLSVQERDNVLYISGHTSNPVKDKMWDIYQEIDPDMRSGDIVMDIQADNTRTDHNESQNATQTYEVKSGDSLSKIATQYPGMTWQKIFDANKDTISDPNKIFPGQKIKIPKN